MSIHHLQRQGVLAAIEEQVRFARQRFGRYDVIDFVAVLFGYAISGERTLEAFYERIQPWAEPFMALFGRDRLPARSTLSRFLASLDQVVVEALRTLFLKDLLARPLENRLLPISGSARLAIPATGSIEWSCVRPSQLSNPTSKHITIPKRASCCAWMGNMGPEPSSPI